ncbi:hypothetical protein BST22_07500 [Mycolicibacterium chubuense]|uniref:DUF2561 domain-containing protein n=1 Tax=Mycolicibacterium chubuense TaxID=1800 RepID=A0A0J6VM67_MYCCU|nr:DUF2561 family protein [Mycolicibacterium chubuense]KMO71324.1 hypothetical protein MCHUDSM44219_05245 [Mycolicibacterium chubuense]ORA54440.1 hypothetical protein BST22_07500 [Mycolicibacterium chubuense]SPX96567.1 Protein of uncharacterised function (DUF2561) [Mycolicibacterium chubuense]
MTTPAAEYTPDRTDRILLGSCAAVWLAALGAGVAATVALVDLAHGRTDGGGDSGTPWFLYVVIGVSAAIIVAAVPLLLRARRDARRDTEPVSRAPERAAEPSAPARGTEAPTEKIRAVTPAATALRAPAPTSSPEVDRLWLRGAASLGCAMGVATLLIGVATYLMAAENDVASWVLYGAAGVVTLGMIAIPVYFLRELRTHTED